MFFAFPQITTRNTRDGVCTLTPATISLSLEAMPCKFPRDLDKSKVEELSALLNLLRQTSLDVDLDVGLGLLPDLLESSICKLREGSSFTASDLPVFLWSPSLFDLLSKLRPIDNLFSFVLPPFVCECRLQASMHLVRKEPFLVLNHLSSLMISTLKIFSTPLATQRQRAVSSALGAITTLVDIGCGAGDYVTKLLSGNDETIALSSVSTVVGVDINRVRLQKLGKELQSFVTTQPDRLCFYQLWFGSVLSPLFLNALAAGIASPVDGVACIEVIEHLQSVELATQATLSILSILRPKVAVFTTPNYEANVILSHANTGSADAVEATYDNSGQKQPFREADHKFEFTREEFRRWTEEIVHLLQVDNLHFTAEMIQIGSLEMYPGGSSVGGATQGVVFRRISPDIAVVEDGRREEREKKTDNKKEVAREYELLWAWNRIDIT